MSDASDRGSGADFRSLSSCLRSEIRNSHQPFCNQNNFISQVHSGRKSRNSVHPHFGRLRRAPSLHAWTSNLSKYGSDSVPVIYLRMNSANTMNLSIQETKKQISSSPRFCHRQIVLYTASSGVFRRILSKSNEVSVQARGIIIYCQRRLSSLKAIVRKIADDW